MVQSAGRGTSYVSALRPTPRRPAGDGSKAKAEDGASSLTWSTLTCNTRQVSKVPSTTLGVSPDGRYLAIADVDACVRLVSTGSLSVARTHKEMHSLPVTALAFSPLSQDGEDGDRDGSPPCPCQLVTISGDSSLAGYRVGGGGGGGLLGFLWAFFKLLLLLAAVLACLIAAQKQGLIVLPLSLSDFAVDLPSAT